MPQFHSSNPLVTDIDAAVLGAQREANELLAQMPHPDVHTPEGLEMLRTLTANNEAGTVWGSEIVSRLRPGGVSAVRLCR
jgi:hypothetical protein